MVVDFVMNPIGIIGYSRVDAGIIGRRTTDAPTGDAGQHETLLARFHILTMNDQRTAAVALTTVNSAGQESGANHVLRYHALIVFLVVAGDAVDNRHSGCLKDVGRIAMLLVCSQAQIRDDLFRAAPTGNEAGRAGRVREVGTGQADGLNILVEVDLLLGLDEGDVVVDLVGIVGFVLDDQLDVDDLLRAFLVSATVISDHDVEQFRKHLQVDVDAVSRRHDPVVADDGTAAEVERCVIRLLKSNGHLPWVRSSDGVLSADNFRMTSDRRKRLMMKALAARRIDAAQNDAEDEENGNDDHRSHFLRLKE